VVVGVVSAPGAPRECRGAPARSRAGKGGRAPRAACSPQRPPPRWVQRGRARRPRLPSPSPSGQHAVPPQTPPPAPRPAAARRPRRRAPPACFKPSPAPRGPRAAAVAAPSGAPPNAAPSTSRRRAATRAAPPPGLALFPGLESLQGALPRALGAAWRAAGAPGPAGVGAAPRLEAGRSVWRPAAQWHCNGEAGSKPGAPPGGSGRAGPPAAGGNGARLAALARSMAAHCTWRGPAGSGRPSTEGGLICCCTPASRPGAAPFGGATRPRRPKDGVCVHNAAARQRRRPAAGRAAAAAAAARARGGAAPPAARTRDARRGSGPRQTGQRQCSGTGPAGARPQPRQHLAQRHPRPAARPAGSRRVLARPARAGHSPPAALPAAQSPARTLAGAPPPVPPFLNAGAPLPAPAPPAQATRPTPWQPRCEPP
jgi:translation initiation factor IF-2